MVNWKIVLIVISIGILLMAIGMWLGYRYISEQDDIHYEAQCVNTSINTTLKSSCPPTRTDGNVISNYCIVISN